MSMRLKQIENEIAGEARYDEKTLGKVAALATRLQSRHQETLTAREMQAIGAEVGLEPAFMRQALAYLMAPEAQQPRLTPGLARKIIACWWAAGWSIIPGTAILANALGLRSEVVALTPFLYVVPGIVMSILLADFTRSSGRTGHRRSRRRWDEEAEEVPSGTVLSRSHLLELLFALQGRLEGQKQRRAFLSIDVVDSAEMKRSGPELAAEYSFGQYRRWVEELVRAGGGEMQSHAGDGVMCIFPTDAQSVRAARRLQDGIARFNTEQNRLPAPFRLRCGVNAGDVPVEEGQPLGHMQSPVIDRAAILQKRADPGDILVSGDVAAAALMELGGFAPLSPPLTGEAVFSWRAGQSSGFPQ